MPPVCTTPTTAASGPMALATSFEPWAKAIEQAVNTINTPKTFSRLSSSCPSSSTSSASLRSKKMPRPMVMKPMTVAVNKVCARLSSSPVRLRPLIMVIVEMTNPTRKMYHGT